MLVTVSRRDGAGLEYDGKLLDAATGTATTEQASWTRARYSIQDDSDVHLVGGAGAIEDITYRSCIRHHTEGQRTRIATYGQNVSV